MSMVREIVFDTETTGLDWSGADRVIELGAVELINHVPSGRTFQTYINPDQPVSAKTTEITGIKDEDLVDKPRFSDPLVVDAFLEFIGDANLVAHNATFDRNFLNMELVKCGRDPILEIRWVDTLMIARKKHPGSPASLDALCKRYDINSDARTFHGALLDSQLLAEVYLELLGGRARAFDFESTTIVTKSHQSAARQRPAPLTAIMSGDELAAHSEFVEQLGEGAIWRLYN
ncbi:MAG: DNA polymerase III subunit epsilon [Hyphomonadaceae bacterium]|nr:DNA polymerase III subunit epsilon [Hyphomonadaceae bacterium]OUX94607.1 MAG: DNA polymerase III subunit epsilon [Hyphomonas sp. TMED17]CAI8351435.1 MAG: DNA polymerase III subunit epsilon [Hyphomonas sp. TMED17]